MWPGSALAHRPHDPARGVVHHYGRDELLRRLAHPFWFQSFAAVMGMDCHSSGITTSVVGEWKRGLAYSRRRSEHVACDAAGELRQIGFAQFGFAHGLPLCLGLEVHAARRCTSPTRQGGPCGPSCSPSGRKIGETPAGERAKARAPLPARGQGPLALRCKIVGGDGRPHSRRWRRYMCVRDRHRMAEPGVPAGERERVEPGPRVRGDARQSHEPDVASLCHSGKT